MKLGHQRQPGARNQPGGHLSLAIGAVWCSLVMLAFPMTSHATEEPDYQVVQTLGDIEVRQYQAYAVAQVVVPGPAADAGSAAFPILAGYIFGKNKGDRKLAMTAPVSQVAEPVKLAMTAPVTQAAAPGGFRVQFVLPNACATCIDVFRERFYQPDTQVGE